MATCLCCPKEPPGKGIVDEVNADECGLFDDEDDDDRADGRSGLHGEWELVLVEAPIGTPAEAVGYKSWLN